MSSLSDFASRIRRHGRRVEEGANLIKRKVALVVDREVVLETPVDTGRARSNWIASIAAPILSDHEPYAPGAKLGKSERANAAAAMEQAQLVISAVKSGDDIYISNNVHYIGLLNEGSSAQAPSGFVQSAVLRGVSAVRGARILS